MPAALIRQSASMRVRRIDRRPHRDARLAGDRGPGEHEVVAEREVEEQALALPLLGHERDAGARRVSRRGEARPVPLMAMSPDEGRCKPKMVSSSSVVPTRPGRTGRRFRRAPPVSDTSRKCGGRAGVTVRLSAVARAAGEPSARRGPTFALRARRIAGQIPPTMARTMSDGSPRHVRRSRRARPSRSTVTRSHSRNTSGSRCDT